jgi:hypothetical protein
MRATTLVLLLALAPGASARTVRAVCRDGIARVPSGAPAWQPACDVGGARDGECRFAFACPLCTFRRPACKAKCLDEPRDVAIRLPIGGRRVVDLPAVDVRLLLHCVPGLRR